MKKSESFGKNTLVRSGIVNAAISEARFQYDVQNIEGFLSLETLYLCLYEMERELKSSVPCVHPAKPLKLLC